MAWRATSRRKGSTLDRMIAPGVSSTISSTPVAVSRARILRPSRPMTRPLSSSLGSATAEPVVPTAGAARRVKAGGGLSFVLQRGRTLAIVGESGSGKSVTSQAILGLHRRTRALTSGQIILDGEDLMGADNERLRTLRGSKMAMIFQDPLSALHPYYTIGSQIVEAIQVHHHMGKSMAKARALEMLDRVGIPNPRQRVDQ